MSKETLVQRTYRSTEKQNLKVIKIGKKLDMDSSKVIRHLIDMYGKEL